MISALYLPLHLGAQLWPDSAVLEPEIGHSGNIYAWDTGRLRTPGLLLLPALPSQGSDFPAPTHASQPTWAGRWLLASRFPTYYVSFFVCKIGVLILVPNHFGED